MRDHAKLVIGFYLLLSFACKQEISKRTAQTIPSIYRIHNDVNFSQILDTLYYNSELFTGFQYAVYPSGDTAFVKSFYHGVEEGKHRAWYPNGKMAEERFYIAGKKEGTHLAWWPNGQLKFKYQFNQNEFNGINQEFYENGTRFKQFHYAMGHEEGRQQMWWINGKIRANYLIKNGRRYGLLGTKNCVNVADSLAFVP